MTKIVQWLKATTSTIANGWCSFMRAIHDDAQINSRRARGRNVTPLID